MFVKKKSFGLVKLYFNVSTSDSITPEEFFEAMRSMVEKSPPFLAVNFDDPQPASSHALWSTATPVSQMECVEILQEDSPVVTILKQNFASRPESEVFHLSCKVRQYSPNLREEVDLLRKLSEKFDAISGYVRVLREDFSPTSETQIRRNFWGTTAHIEKWTDSWLTSSAPLYAGGVKGIYPVNYWSETSLQRLKGIGFQFPPHIDLSGKVVEFDENDQLEIVRNNREFSKFIHFGNT